MTDSTDLLSIKTVSTISSLSSKLYWRRRQNCCTNFYAILWTIFRRNEMKRRNSKLKSSQRLRLTQSVGGDFIYTNAYEVLLPSPRNSPNSIGKMSNDLYFLRSESLNLSPPPPLPQRNFSQSSDSISPQPRPDIGTFLASPSPPPKSPSQSVLSKKFRKTVFTNSHFEPLLEEDDDIFSSKTPSVIDEETVSVQIHRETSATPKRSIPQFGQHFLLTNLPLSRSGSKLSRSGSKISRSGSKLSHISVLSTNEVLNRSGSKLSRSGSRISRIIPIFEDRNSISRLSGTISINSRLFADDKIRSSQKSENSFSDFRTNSFRSNSFRSNEDRQSLMHDERSMVVSPTKFENSDNFKFENSDTKVGNSDVDESLILETDYYVRQMKQRRNQVKIVDFLNFIKFIEMRMQFILTKTMFDIFVTLFPLGNLEMS